MDQGDWPRKSDVRHRVSASGTVPDAGQIGCYGRRYPRNSWVVKAKDVLVPPGMAPKDE
jgi:hypothetical protein